MIYKILTAGEWSRFQADGRFDGSAFDRTDGYIHLSSRDQVVETAARHFAGQLGLVLVTVDPGGFGDELRWEPARGGALFPHIYGTLPMAAVVRAEPVPDAGIAALLEQYEE